MRVSVFGLGYVGCVTASCLAKAGHEVVGVDIRAEKVAMLNDAVPPVVEPGLANLLSEVIGQRRLRATVSAAEAVDSSELALICVGTPGNPNGKLNASAIDSVGREIGAALRERPGPYSVILRSTVLPGTTEKILLPALRTEAGDGIEKVRVAFNPEFMREGSSLRDFVSPPFTLVGCEEPETASLLGELYAGVEAPFIQTSVRNAEMVKYVSNAFHAVKICFANEIGDLCESLGVQSQEVMRLFAMDRKLNISEAYLRPGFAFGGSCLPKDLRALLYAGRTADLPLPLLSSIVRSNEAQIRRQITAVIETRKRKIGVVGLSFKPGTDDLRESPMVTLIEALIGKGLDVRILDKNVSLARLTGANRSYIEQEIPHIASLLCGSVEELLAHAEVVIVGNAGEDATLALESAGPKRIVIDLTRGAAQR